MKKNLSFLLLLLWTLTFAEAQKPKSKKSTSSKTVSRNKTQNKAKTTSQPAYATLVLRSDTDCEVFIDGQKLKKLFANSVEERLYVMPGRHTLELKNEEGKVLENGVQLLILNPNSFQFFNFDLATKKQLAVDKINRENTDKSVINTAKELYIKKEYTAAFNLLKVQQESGLMDATAYTYLGDCYHNAYKGIAVNNAEAVKAYTKAYAIIGPKNSSDLAVLIADIYRSGGSGLEKSIIETQKWYQKSYSQGNTRAEYELGSLLFYGAEGIEKDTEKGFKMLVDAAEKGENKAQWLLGIIYSKGAENIEKDLVKAKYWYKKVAVNADEKVKKSVNSN